MGDPPIKDDLLVSSKMKLQVVAKREKFVVLLEGLELFVKS